MVSTEHYRLYTDARDHFMRTRDLRKLINRAPASRMVLRDPMTRRFIFDDLETGARAGSPEGYRTKSEGMQAFDTYHADKIARMEQQVRDQAVAVRSLPADVLAELKKGV